MNRTLLALAQLSPEKVELFLSRVNRAGGPSACWPWLGATDTHGYGVFGVGGHRTVALKAHRVAIVVASGVPLAHGDHVLHSCDNPPCCNPAHLRVANHAENMRDAVARNRHRRGTAHADAKLTEESVRSIRAERAAGSTLRGLAAKYGVRHGTLTAMLAGRTWRHVL